MKRKICNILFGLLFLFGFLVLAYPTIADQWNTYRQNRLISSYELRWRRWSRRISQRNGKPHGS